MPFEIDYLLFLQGLRETLPSFITAFLSGVSWLANSPLPIIAVAVIMWCVSKEAGYFIGFNYTTSNFITQTVKCIACINRPWIIDPRVTPEPSAIAGATGYSFPSGHSTLAGSVYGSAAYWFRKYRWLAVVLIVLIVLTVFSRNWLGCHTPKDVIAGVLIALVMLFLSTKFFKYIETHPEKDVMCAVIGIVVGVAALLLITFKSYPLEYAADGSLLVNPESLKIDGFRSVGAYLGFCVAWILERRFIKFSVEGSTKTRIIRGIVGAVFIALVYLAILPLVTNPLGDHFGKFLKYFVLLICVGNLYPLIFSKFEAWRAKK